MDNRLTSPGDVDAHAAGDGAVKIVAQFTARTGAPDDGDLVDVTFDGINGFGTANAPTA